MKVSTRDIIAALQRRRERRREAVGELGYALSQLRASVERHLERIASVRAAIEARGGDPADLDACDSAMDQIRAQLTAAEREIAAASKPSD